MKYDFAGALNTTEAFSLGRALAAIDRRKPRSSSHVPGCILYQQDSGEVHTLNVSTFSMDAKCFTDDRENDGFARIEMDCRLDNSQLRAINIEQSEHDTFIVAGKLIFRLCPSSGMVSVLVAESGPPIGYDFLEFLKSLYFYAAFDSSILQNFPPAFVVSWDANRYRTTVFNNNYLNPVRDFICSALHFARELFFGTADHYVYHPSGRVGAIYERFYFQFNSDRRDHDITPSRLLWSYCNPIEAMSIIHRRSSPVLVQGYLQSDLSSMEKEMERLFSRISREETAIAKAGHREVILTDC